MESLSQQVRYYKIRPSLWDERIVAAYCESDRMQALLEQDDYYQRVARLCHPAPFGKSPFELNYIGASLSHVGNRGMSKRELSMLLNIHWNESQKMMNKYYEVFHMVRYWIKKNTVKIACELIDNCKNRQLDAAFTRCCSTLPDAWQYAGELSFKVPSYIYEVQVEKFLRHHFEREIEIRDKMLRLPVQIENYILDKPSQKGTIGPSK